RVAEREKSEAARGIPTLSLRRVRRIRRIAPPGRSTPTPPLEARESAGRRQATGFVCRLDGAEPVEERSRRQDGGLAWGSRLGQRVAILPAILGPACSGYITCRCHHSAARCGWPSPRRESRSTWSRSVPGKGGWIFCA